ncbi:MAG: hypothetical protein ACREQF_12030 [Candidatus Binataceae bacterium]
MTADSGDRAARTLALKGFIDLGCEILRTNEAAHYGFRPPHHRGFQPGFMPPAKATKLLVLGANPSSGKRHESTSQRTDEERSLKRWKDEGTVEAYLEAYGVFLRDFQSWTVFAEWVRPVLEAAVVSVTEIAWLNTVKSPTPSGFAPPVDMVRLDSSWLRRQIELVRPDAILYGGVAVAKNVRKFLGDGLPPRVVQNRNRHLTAEQRSQIPRIHRELGRRIRAILDGASVGGWGTTCESRPR